MASAKEDWQNGNALRWKRRVGKLATGFDSQIFRELRVPSSDLVQPEPRVRFPGEVITQIGEAKAAKRSPKPQDWVRFLAPVPSTRNATAAVCLAFLAHLPEKLIRMSAALVAQR